jgi:TldD protein
MNQPVNPDHFLLEPSGLDLGTLQRTVNDALVGMDDGELYLEYSQSESLVWDDGLLRSASYNTDRGFGLRSVMGEAAGYAHASEISEDAIRRAVGTVRAIHTNEKNIHAAITPAFGTNQALYTQANPLQEVPFEAKIQSIQAIDAYVRAKDPRVKQVSVSIAGVWQAIRIIRAGNQTATDIRPLVRLTINVAVEQNGRMETGNHSGGGRMQYATYLEESTWKRYADQALAQALVKLDSKPSPAGEMPVVLGPGWCGVLLHEAIGHGLEGDFHRKKTSVYSGMMGQQIAAKGVTVVDDGTLENRRGSLSIDDEGTPTGRTVLIEDGNLTGLLQDRLNARLMGVRATGNGRRESYAHQPMPRMTNTFMLNGNHTQEEMVASVKRGILAVNMGGGQVDITSGKFVFSVSEAYMIEDGKITHPVKGATLIGTGADVLKKITMIGNDTCLDEGTGTCGKSGQDVPVGVGQPSMLIEGITVGGTQV